MKKLWFEIILKRCCLSAYTLTNKLLEKKIAYSKEKKSPNAFYILMIKKSK